MKVSLLVPDISAPILGAATTLARAIQKTCDVEIIGPDLGGGVNPMYRDAFPYRAVPCPRIYRFPDFFRDARRLEEAVTGDVVIAVKAYADTVPLALRARRRRGVRAMVYLDEWDGALVAQQPWPARAGRWLRHAHHPLDECYVPLVEKLIPRADQVISTTTFLQQRFGGRIVHFGVDTEVFKPQPERETVALRRQLGLEGKRLILFGGVVRPHKGIEQILEALARLARPDARFVIVGPVNEHVQGLLAHPRWGAYVTALGAMPRDDMPRHLALADLVIVPLTDSLLARSQMPCKVFEAMAMAKPVMATAISDLPAVVNGCGWVIPPSDIDALTSAMARALDRPDECVEMGRAARARCEALYSRRKMEENLAEILLGS